MSVLLDSRLENSQTWITSRDSQLLPPLLQLECRNITAIFQQVSAVESLKSVMCISPHKGAVKSRSKQLFLSGTFSMPFARQQSACRTSLFGECWQKKWQLSIRILESNKHHSPKRCVCKFEVLRWVGIRRKSTTKASFSPEQTQIQYFFPHHLWRKFWIADIFVFLLSPYETHQVFESPISRILPYIRFIT